MKSRHFEDPKLEILQQLLRDQQYFQDLFYFLKIFHKKFLIRQVYILLMLSINPLLNSHFRDESHSNTNIPIALFSVMNG